MRTARSLTRRARIVGSTAPDFVLASGTNPSNDNNAVSPIRLLMPVLALALLAACSEDPQHRYQEATQALEAARKARTEAESAVEDRKQALADQQRKLDQAKQKLAEARERLEAANQRVDEAVSDEVLFRAVQRAVLDPKRFPDAAIAVGVDDRVVTLTGTVPDAATKKAALEAAGAHPGVREVRDQLKIASGKAGKTGKNAPDA